MTVTFNGIVLADGEARTCKVAAGLAPSGELSMEILEYLRAAWAVPVARGNRIFQLPMNIQLPSNADFEGALVEALMYFANLPDEGELKIQHGAALVTFSQAVCAKVKVNEIDGLANDISLVFTCGEPTTATLSPLAQMDPRYPNILNLTGLTGGAAGDLDAQITTDVAVGRYVDFDLLVSGDRIPHRWKLCTWTDETEDADAGRVLPDDFNSTTNPKFWLRLI